jgi:hypothetical protein
MGLTMKLRFLFIYTTLIVSTIYSFVSANESDPQEKRRMSKGIKSMPYQKSFFKKDPINQNLVYDSNAQKLIYGGKSAVNTARPLLEIGRGLYAPGEYKPGLPFHFIVYGDIQTGSGFNRFASNQEAVLGLRANLELDLKLTSTERIHALIQPFDTNNLPTQISLLNQGKNTSKQGFSHTFRRCIDDKIDANGCTALEAFDEIFGNLFFEGEMKNIPFSLGKIPHLLQNGVWMEDAYLGAAMSIASKNSVTFDISNYDISFFVAGLGVNDRVFGGANRNGGDQSIFGTSFFLETLGGYIEGGYGFVFDHGSQKDRVLFSQDIRLNGKNFSGNLSYHNFTIALTKRYGGWLSNSIRLIGNVGQENLNILNPTLTDPKTVKNANGFAILIENSLITKNSLTFVPYFNLFIGIDSPQAIAKQFGLLRNTGILFENNILTGQQSLFDNPDDSVGGALGLQYLFALDQQLVLEVAGSASICRDKNAKNLLNQTCKRGQINGENVLDQAAVGLRYQLPFQIIKKAWIFRADSLFGTFDSESQNHQTFFGARIELRRKF